MSRELSLGDFKAVLFDVDGTLVDTMDKIVNGLGDAIEHYAGKRPTDEATRKLIGLPLTVQLRMHVNPDASDEELNEMIQYTILRYEYHQHLDRELTPAVDALRLCHQAGMKTALVTSRNAQEMVPFVQTFSGMDSVHASVNASDVARPKPDPECVIRACELLDVTPEEALYIGDAIFDMQSARAAGATPVAVAYGSATAEDLAKENPALLLETPQALLAFTRQTITQSTCRERNRI